MRHNGQEIQMCHGCEKSIACFYMPTRHRTCKMRGYNLPVYYCANCYMNCGPLSMAEWYEFDPFEWTDDILYGEKV